MRSAFTIYNASAGSGKTYTLAKEYIKIVLLSNANDAYKNVLAITFTNKAVEEMKSRILYYLLEFSKENTSKKAQQLLDSVVVETQLSYATVKEKSKAIVKNIIHNYTAFDISTIDKFTLKVIKSFLHELHLPQDFDVSLDTDLLMQEAVETVISKAGNDLELTKLLLDFSKNKTDEDKSWDISFDLLQASKLLTNENYKKDLQDIEKLNLFDFIEAKKSIEKSLQINKSKIIENSKICLDYIDKNSIPYNAFSYASFPNHIQKFNTLQFKYEDVHKYKHVEDVSVKKTVYSEKILTILPIVLDKLNEIYLFAQKYMFLLAANEKIYPMSLLNSIYQEFKKIQVEQNTVSIAAFNQIIHEQIQAQPAPFIYEKIGSRYKHFFIDEFQDTSIMQWENLFPLLDNALSSEENNIKGSLLIVGDPKQAIYRWRGGKAEQFINLSNQKSPFSNPEKETIYLDTNYRSFSEIIFFNNNFFAFMANKMSFSDYVDLYQNNSYQKENSKKGGQVTINFISSSALDEDETKEDLFLSETLSKINECISNGFDYKDIAILTRTKSKGVLVANYLTEHAVPILSSETLLIQNATEVKLIINVLHYLYNPINLDAKFQWLFYIAKYKLAINEAHDFISENLNKTEVEIQSDLKKNGIWLDFNFWRKQSLYEAVENIIAAFIPQEAINSYVQYFLDLVLERHTKSQSGIGDFLEYWDVLGFQKSIPSPEGKNAVRIVTIHKSKGLEFPVVIYPFANDDFSVKKKDPLWIPLETENILLNKVLINNKKDVIIYSDTSNKIYSVKEQEDVLDTINVMYVALTRAEEQLHIISELKINKDGKLPNALSSFFIEFLQNQNKFDKEINTYTFGSPERNSDAIEHLKQTEEIRIIQNKVEASAIKIAKRDAVMWGTMQQEAISFGNTLHEILAFITSQNDINLALTKSLEKGLIKSTQLFEIKEYLKKIVFHDNLFHFFTLDGKVYNEKAILSSDKQLIKPDKIKLIGTKAYLLDYKTGNYTKKHEQQLLFYAQNLKEMGFDVVEKKLVYISEKIKIISL